MINFDMARDWSTFTRRITVNYPTKAIYDAWAIPSQIERWFLRSAEYVGVDGASKNRDREVEAGDSYLWRWHGYLDDVSESGMILEANGLDKFAFTFTNGCPRHGIDRRRKGETVVELIQSQIPDDPSRHIYIECGLGWAFYLANLKSILEGGIDLRNRNVDIKDVVNA
ncbi:MAG: SRPBCC domain-containing protein [Acidobacteria bacterium]|nr:SRPBCC domain-containing protein [Acidobacteriota bacterium]